MISTCGVWLKVRLRRGGDKMNQQIRGEQQITGVDPENILLRRCVNERSVHIHNGQQYEAAQVLERVGVCIVFRGLDNRLYLRLDEYSGGEQNDTTNSRTREH